MSEWTSEELAEMGALFFRRQRVRCPRCLAAVEGRSHGSLGRVTEDVDFSCKRCGLRATYCTRHLEAMRLHWTHTQRLAIVDSYFEHKAARCPVDGALLHFLAARGGPLPRPDDSGDSESAPL